MTGVNFYLSDLIFPSCAVFCTSRSGNIKFSLRWCINTACYT